jgi:hypothetical protein
VRLTTGYATTDDEVSRAGATIDLLLTRLGVNA